MINEVRTYLVIFVLLLVALFSLFQWLKVRLKKTKIKSKPKPIKVEPLIKKDNNELITEQIKMEDKEITYSSSGPHYVFLRLLPKNNNLVKYSLFQRSMEKALFKYTEDKVFVRVISKEHSITIANLVEPGYLVPDNSIKGLTIFTEINHGIDTKNAFDMFIQIVKNISFDMSLSIYQSDMNPLTTQEIANIRDALVREVNEHKI